MNGLIGGLRVGSCQITKNQIKCNLIKIIQFSLKIFDLWSHRHLWVVVWMDIWHFLTFYLNYLSPLQGFFIFIRFLNPIDMIGCGGDP